MKKLLLIGLILLIAGGVACAGDMTRARGYKTLDSDDYHTNTGHRYEASYYNPALATDSLMNITLTTGTTYYTEAKIIVGAGQDCILSVNEDPVLGGAGTALTAYNHNRPASPNLTCESTIVSDATISDESLTLSEVLIPGGATGLMYESEPFFLSASGGIYTFKLKNISSSTDVFGINLLVTEHKKV